MDVWTLQHVTSSEAATDAGTCSYPLTNYDCEGNNLQPIFTIYPEDITVQGSEVDNINNIILEAAVSPYAAAFESQYNDNECYATDSDVIVEVTGEFVVSGNCEHDYTFQIMDCN